MIIKDMVKFKEQVNFYLNEIDNGVHRKDADIKIICEDSHKEYRVKEVCVDRFQCGCAVSLAICIEEAKEN